jgi:hypothetical protein
MTLYLDSSWGGFLRIGYIRNIIDVMLLNNNFNLRYIIVDFIWIIGLELSRALALCTHMVCGTR